MADIMMNYASLEEAARKINTAEGDLEAIITNLTNVVSTLGENYTGASYNAFLAAWNDSKPAMERLKAAVGNFAPALKTAADNQRELENTAAQRMGGLGF